ncbi:hypothetical protein E2C01_035388 [Portunus trituberculatus]|uniref:Uncharacterized protein n=1 Tax=Portunus trituberculatus TaxID=210409 RepID=A0A5B7F9M1_PORTR|nr:hypothetical protein [Portunus trituberculatus]
MFLCMTTTRAGLHAPLTPSLVAEGVARGYVRRRQVGRQADIEGVGVVVWVAPLARLLRHRLRQVLLRATLVRLLTGT